MSEPWIDLNDPHVTPGALAETVAARVAERRAAHGAPRLDFPAFGYVAAMPEIDPARAPTLAHHLRHLNDLPAPPVEPVLALSPATRVPVFGRIWSLIRAQAHALVLFYTSRLAAHQTQAHNHTVSALNELTRLTLAQQAEIDRLRAEVERLRASPPPGDDAP